MIFMYLARFGYLSPLPFFPNQNKKAWIRYFECQASLGLPPPSSLLAIKKEER